MGSSLGPVLANIVVTKLEDVVIKPLIADGTIKFYSSFNDDNLLAMKSENLSQVIKVLKKFDKNLLFTVDMFQNEIPQLLDFELAPDENKSFRKDTNTGLYVNSTSLLPWTYCTLWVRSLVTRASRVCSADKMVCENIIIKSDLLCGMNFLSQLSFNYQ